MLTITPLQQAGVQVLPPDVVLVDGTVGDLALDGRNGLLAANPIATAVILCLLTDARCEPEQLRIEHAGDRRGWVGDGFDLDTSRYETEMGSRLWLYRRSELVDETGRQIEDEALRALDVLIRQGLAARIEAKAEVQKAEGRVVLAVAVIGSDGTTRAAVRFDPLWRLI